MTGGQPAAPTWYGGTARVCGCVCVWALIALGPPFAVCTGTTQYLINGDTKNACHKGMAILSADECKVAAKALNVTFERSLNSKYWLKGCSYLPPYDGTGAGGQKRRLDGKNGRFYFNSHSLGKTTPSSNDRWKLVCAVRGNPKSSAFDTPMRTCIVDLSPTPDRLLSPALARPHPALS